jgi:hypothetical protein
MHLWPDTCYLKFANGVMADERFSIAGSGDPILLPVTVAEKSYTFILDTNASHHVFDRSLLGDLGTVVGDAIGGAPEHKDMKALLVNAPTFRVGGLLITGRGKSAVLDLDAFRRGIGEDIRGVLGSSFLSQGLVTIDPDAGTLTVTPRNHDVSSLGTSDAIRVDDRGAIWVDGIHLGQRTESFTLATAVGPSIRVHKWLFDRLLAEGQLTSRGSLALSNVSGYRAQRWGRLAELRWGTDELRNLVVYEGSSNLIGMGLLSRYVVTFDMEGKRVYRKPGQRFGMSDHVNQTGLHVESVDGTIRVESVDIGSPAEKADIRAGDQLCQLNGKPCRELRLLNVLRVLEESVGTDLRIEVFRGEDALTTIVTVPNE